MFPEDQEEEKTERLMGYVVPSVRRESMPAPRCHISLRLSHRPAETMSSHPHLRRHVQTDWNGSFVVVCTLFLWALQTAASLTDLMEEFRKLHLHFLPLEHVIFRLFADWWNLVKLSGHRVCFLKNMSQIIRLEFLKYECSATQKCQISKGSFKRWIFLVFFVMSLSDKTPSPIHLDYLLKLNYKTNCTFLVRTICTFLECNGGEKKS